MLIFVERGLIGVLIFVVRGLISAINFLKIFVYLVQFFTQTQGLVSFSTLLHEITDQIVKLSLTMCQREFLQFLIFLWT